MIPEQYNYIFSEENVKNIAGVVSMTTFDCDPDNPCYVCTGIAQDVLTEIRHQIDRANNDN